MANDRDGFNGYGDDRRDDEGGIRVDKGAMSFGAALALIPQFSGEKGVKVKDFTKAVTSAGKLANCNDEQLAEVARLKLTGLANEFLDASMHLDAAPWSEIKRELEERFHVKTSPEEWSAKLRTCQQEPAETVKEFETRIRLWGYRSLKLKQGDMEGNKIRQGMLDDEMLSVFKKGLRVEIGRQMAGLNPSTLSTAVELAENIESYENVTKTTVVAAVKRVDAPVPAPRTRNYNDYARERSQSRGRDNSRGRYERGPSRGRDERREYSDREWSRGRDGDRRDWSRGRNSATRDWSRGRDRDSRDYSRDRGRDSRDYSRGRERDSRDYSRGRDRDYRDYSRGRDRRGRDWSRGRDQGSRGRDGSRGKDYGGDNYNRRDGSKNRERSQSGKREDNNKRSSTPGRRDARSGSRGERRCFECDSPNHIKRDCPVWIQKERSENTRGESYSRQ
ncbi:Embryonic protein DC-8 [Frankliniella fusca]|uniref:Embryonic protein DC-8 n=1 Tax=Frankliniella fusca TaxID=407009 RepID=A0AAE1LBM1_9NEOP|nr:Embryonic protein DC-8 [Frankliniella fusca]